MTGGKPLNVAVLAGRSPRALRQHVGSSSGACGHCGSDLVVLEDGLAVFWPEEGYGVVGEVNRSYLSCYLSFYQILSEQRPF